MNFATDYNEILNLFPKLQPVRYTKTRNFIDGDVSYLSPYISRGVISLQQVKNYVLQKHKPFAVQKFLQELAWREYWQRVWQNKGKEIFRDLKYEQQEVQHHKMITAVQNAATGIKIIDECINKFYATGYMHNHMRMYVSSIVCNMAKAHWLQPSQWMYYYLLDGDIASNTLSWQWVAGTLSGKKYYYNQENINHYTHTHQRQTFLDAGYESLAKLPIADVLQTHEAINLKTVLPATGLPLLQSNLPLFVYNSFNLDPLWHKDENANRILLLEPSHFNKHPVSEKVIEFIIALSKNIKGLQIFTGEFDALAQLYQGAIYFKKHPSFLHYKGVAEEYEWMFPQVTGYYPSFFSYWKKCEQFLNSKSEFDFTTP